MLRRDAIAVMLAGCLRGGAETFPGVAVLIDILSRKVLSVEGDRRTAPAPPGSTLKPFALESLLQTGKLRADETFPCPGPLTIAGRSMACSHPAVGSPMDARTALAYSCNCFVARFARRFAPGQLAGGLSRFGLTAEKQSGDRQQLQALGESGIIATAEELARAYCRLALHSSDAVRAGLESAVEYGTAQLARIEGIAVAGKTGSVRRPDGTPVAWFAGFAPSRSPKVAVAVMVAGRSGGADAAPIAARLLRERL